MPEVGQKLPLGAVATRFIANRDGLQHIFLKKEITMFNFGKKMLAISTVGIIIVLLIMWFWPYTPETNTLPTVTVTPTPMSETIISECKPPYGNEIELPEGGIIEIEGFRYEHLVKNGRSIVYSHRSGIWRSVQELPFETENYVINGKTCINGNMILSVRRLEPTPTSTPTVTPSAIFP